MVASRGCLCKPLLVLNTVWKRDRDIRLLQIATQGGNTSGLTTFWLVLRLRFGWVNADFDGETGTPLCRVQGNYLKHSRCRIIKLLYVASLRPMGVEVLGIRS